MRSAHGHAPVSITCWLACLRALHANVASNVIGSIGMRTFARYVLFLVGRDAHVSLFDEDRAIFAEKNDDGVDRTEALLDSVRGVRR